MNPLPTEEKANLAAHHLRTTGVADQTPFGIILGTGSGIVSQNIAIENEIDYGDIPHFPASTALGHKGSLIFGKLGSQPVVALNGRFHLYEGHDVDAATLAVRVMRELGVRYLFITNAAGGLNPKFASGDVMAINSHIDLMFRLSCQSSTVSALDRPAMRTDQYDEEMTKYAHSIARLNDFCLQTGVYAGLLGPNYETRAEYRMLRRIGADVAGMSTIPEVYVATKLGLRVLALSIVTNVAKPDVLEETSGQEVIDAAQTAAPKIHLIIQGCIESLAKSAS